MCDFGCCSVKRGCVAYTYVNQPQNTIYTGSVGQTVVLCPLFLHLKLKM